MSFNQPGPYGPPQPPQPPQPPYGSQVPQGPNPYAQAPQAPQPPMPPMPSAMPFQAPQPQGKGKTAAIVATAVVLVAAIAGGGWMLLKGGDDKKPAKAAASSAAKPAAPSAAPSSAAPTGKRYKLVAPDKVADTYAKDASASGDGFDSADLEDLKTLGVVNPQNVSATYKAGDESTQKVVKFTGAWGEVKNPETVVDGLFHAMAASAGKEKDGTNTSVEGTPQKVTPAGLDDGAVLKCQNMVMSGPVFAGHTLKTPMCIWADHSTVGTVIHMDASAIRTGVTPTADEAGAFAAGIRHDMRVEIPN